MPPNRTRTSNPQGRQKSCAECAKAKRRCDLRQPHCLRCTRQKLTCVYPPQPHISITPVSLVDTPNTDRDAEDVEDVRLPYSKSTGTSTSADGPASETNLLDLDNFSNLTSFGGFGDLTPNLDDGKIIDLPTPGPNLIPGGNLSTFMLSSFAESRLGYSIEHLKQAPRMMLEESATHWCHSKLYEDYMPKSMQDAYAACGLHVSRTKNNATFIARHVIERAQELLEQPPPTPPIEILARAQALLLYEIILIFSGDFRCFGQAEELIPVLEENGASLMTILSNEDDSMDPLPFYPTHTSRSAWTSFIFRESCRRTLLIACHAVAACRTLRGRLGPCAHHLAIGNRVTISTALWGAQSPFEFATAWNEKRHLLVKDLDFDEVLRKAQADDIDVFGRMIMVGLMGIDDVKGWIHTRGGKL